MSGDSTDSRSTPPEQAAGVDATQVRAVSPMNEKEAATALSVDIDSNAPSQRRISTAVDVAPGAVIKDRFVLAEQIGQGGMGIVFAARDRRKEEANDPNPWVAVKVLSPAFARHESALVALQREARKAQSLAHPNVATVFDFDRDGDTVYMTMELLRGKTLSSVTQAARGQGIERDRAMSIVREIASGLAYAHRKGIVHADLKPGNVFLLDDKHAKILDFGIARAVPSGAAAAEARDTFDAGMLGAFTEAYATAEMMTGADPHPSDDLYALGLIAYELLTGHHPYQGRSAIEARKLALTPSAPKGIGGREWRVLKRCLAFDRRERPQDAAEFLRQLAGIRPLQKALIAASLVLALAAGFFGYRSYVAAGPAVPFASLPAETQQEFTAYMSEGDQLAQFFRTDGNLFALQEAVQQYDAAYRLHPRNRDATRALERAAVAMLDTAQDNAERKREIARQLSELSEYLRKYPPVEKAK